MRPLKVNQTKNQNLLKLTECQVIYLEKYESSICLDI